MGKKQIGHSPDADELFDRTQTFADWCKVDDNLLLVESWTRDGYTITDIANRLGISPTLITRARHEVPEFDAALRVGRELVDYKVENALLRVALGYKTKEVKVTTTMRYGQVVETLKEVTEKEQAPNVAAIQTFLTGTMKHIWRSVGMARGSHTTSPSKLSSSAWLRKEKCWWFAKSLIQSLRAVTICSERYSTI